MGGGGWLLTSFFSIIYILGLVCYKHTIHVYTHIGPFKFSEVYSALGILAVVSVRDCGYFLLVEFF